MRIICGFKRNADCFARLAMLLFLSFNSVSCRQKDQTPQPINSAEIIENKARDYLQPLLRIGEDVTNIIERFGQPQHKSETQTKELCLDFFFPDGNSKALAAGVGGFSAFFISNQLTHWDPIYETRNPNFEDSSVKHPAVSFSSDRVVFGFSLISDEKKEGSIYLDEGKFQKLGYINKAPDLPVYSGKYMAYESADRSGGSLEFVLSQSDSEKLKALTTENVGKRIALLIGSQVVAAPFIQEPISSGRVMLNLPEAAYITVLQALKERTK